MALIDTGSSTAGKANVTSTYDLQVRTPRDESDAGFVQISSENDSGAVMPSRLVLAPETSDDYRLRVGIDQSLFNLSFEGTVIARDRIQQTDTVATSAQTGGVLTINSGNSTTSGQGSFIRTYRTFPMFGAYPLYCEFWASESNPTATFAVTEYGIGYCTGVTAQLTDGVFLRRLAGGQLRLVVTYAGADVAISDITETNIPDRDGTGAYNSTQMNHYVIVSTMTFAAAGLTTLWLHPLIQSARFPRPLSQLLNPSLPVCITAARLARPAS